MIDLRLIFLFVLALLAASYSARADAITVYNRSGAMVSLANDIDGNEPLGDVYPDDSLAINPDVMPIYVYWEGDGLVYEWSQWVAEITCSTNNGVFQVLEGNVPYPEPPPPPTEDEQAAAAFTKGATHASIIGAGTLLFYAMRKLSRPKHV